MKNRYRMFRRGNVYYSHDGQTGKQESLRTSDGREAQKLLNAKNDASENSHLNLALGRVYLAACDPTLPTRTWQGVMDTMIANARRDSTRYRTTTAMESKPFDRIRDKRLCETTADDFLAVLGAGGTAVNLYLRTLHNLALKFGWLPWPIMPPKAWPTPIPTAKRGIRADEHQKLLATEKDPEWRLYFEMLWEIGASQTDAALLSSANVDWDQRTIFYQRKKLPADAEPAIFAIGPRLELILRSLPQEGPFFRNLSHQNDSIRAWHFNKLCKRAGIRDVTLHSYRYAWAERAKSAGMPERFAMQALGHNSKAVHRAYSKKAHVKVPSLEEYEQKIIPMPTALAN